jgi:putative transposase
MKRRRHTPEQIVRKLREADRLLGEGMELPEVANQLEVSEATCHRWRAQYGGMRADDVKRLNELEVENARLKRIVADQSLEVQALKEIAGEPTVPAERLRPERPDHVWALDVQFDQTADGRLLKLLNVVDEVTREALAIECRRRIDADHTVKVRDRVVAERNTAPAFIRCDDGPELTANALRDWCRFSRAGSAYIEPGSPWQNPYVESFGSRLRDELLAVELFSCLAEAQVVIEDWRQDYNQRRPHSALGMTTPSAFGAGYRAYLATLEQLSTPDRIEQGLARTTTINNHQLSHEVDR